MSNKQLTIISIILSVVTLLLIIELSKTHISKGDIVGIVGFLAGAAAVIAFMRAGGDK